METNTVSIIQKLLETVIKVGPHTKALIVSALDQNHQNGYVIGQQFYQAIIQLRGAANQIVYKPRLYKYPMDQTVYNLMKSKEFNLIIQTDVDCLGHDPVGKIKPYVLKGKQFTNILYYRRAKKEIQAFWFYINDLKNWVKSVDVNYQELGKISKEIKDRLEKATTVKIKTGKNELSFRLNKKNKPTANYDFTQHLLGGGGNIPLGEVWITPDMSSATGSLLIDGSFYNELEEKTVTVKTPMILYFEKGKLIKTEGKNETGILTKVIAEITDETKRLKIDSTLKKIYADNILRIGEFAIGVNKNADFCNDLLIDEKKYGTAHIALGRSYNGDPALYHCDLISRTPEIELVYKNGTSETILRQGEILI